MNLELYIKLTGKAIPANTEDYYKAQIKRVQSKLETLLGYTLTPKDLYNELGKTQSECFCPDIPESSALLPPDEKKGIIKVFPFNAKDKYLLTDPYYEVYTVKLGRVIEKGKFISYKTFETVSPQFMQNGIGNSIERCATCYCDCNCKDCMQLIVDADWVDFNEDEDLPDDLLYLWCDMVDYYADPDKDIKSESVDGHSWSKGDVITPEETELSKLLLQHYAGPFGQVIRIPTV